MFRACRPWLMFLALAVLPGCHFSGRAYEGATRPESSVSVLRGHNRVFGGGIFIQQVDNQTPFYPMLTKVEILPGRHTIQIVYSSYRPNYILSLPPMTAILETEPGHKYEIDGEGDLFKTDKPRVWIVDTTTEKIVWVWEQGR